MVPFAVSNLLASLGFAAFTVKFDVAIALGVPLIVIDLLLPATSYVTPLGSPVTVQLAAMSEL